MQDPMAPKAFLGSGLYWVGSACIAWGMACIVAVARAHWGYGAESVEGWEGADPPQETAMLHIWAEGLGIEKFLRGGAKALWKGAVSIGHHQIRTLLKQY